MVVFDVSACKSIYQRVMSSRSYISLGICLSSASHALASHGLRPNGVYRGPRPKRHDLLQGLALQACLSSGFERLDPQCLQLKIIIEN